MKALFLGIIMFLVAGQAAMGREVGEYSQRFAKEALDQRLCVSLATSFEFLAHGLSHILHRHLKFYNNPSRYAAFRDD